jgi:hypothetical protein
VQLAELGKNLPADRWVPVVVLVDPLGPEMLLDPIDQLILVFDLIRRDLVDHPLSDLHSRSHRDRLTREQTISTRGISGTG